MSMKNLIKIWNLPDRSSERAQITLRIPFTDYARLHALKDVYPTRSVNDILTDIIRMGLDEVVEALPSWSATEEDAAISRDEVGPGFPSGAYVDPGDPLGPAVDFERAYRRILREKSEDDSKEVAA